MADLTVNANITAPDNIDVPLVRGDMMIVSETFRIGFEVFLALTFTVVGSLINPPATVSPAVYVLLGVGIVGMIACLGLGIYWRSKAGGRSNANQPNNEAPPAAQAPPPPPPQIEPAPPAPQIAGPMLVQPPAPPHQNE